MIFVMHQKFLSLLFLYLLTSAMVLGQVNEENDYVRDNSVSSNSRNAERRKFSWDRVAVGGGFGLNFGNVTYIELAPSMGYYLTKNLISGVNLNYIYFSNRTTQYSTHIYGGGLFSQYLFRQLPIMLHAEAEWINYDSAIRSKRIDTFGLLVGGGIQQRVSENSFIYFLGLWNLNETIDSFNQNPVIRAGVSIGL